MKRKDIELGKPYLVSGSKDWERRGGYGAVVVDRRNWAESHGYARTERSYLLENGEQVVVRGQYVDAVAQGVLVRVATGALAETLLVVPLSHIRCDYEVGVQKVAEARRAVQAAREAKDARHVAREREQRALIDELAKLDVKVERTYVRWGNIGEGEYKLTISETTAAALIEKLQGE